MQQQLLHERNKLQIGKDTVYQRHEQLENIMRRFKQSYTEDQNSLHQKVKGELHAKHESLKELLQIEREIFEKDISESKADIEQLHDNLEVEWTRFRRDIQRAALASLMNKPWRQDLEATSASFSKWPASVMFRT